MKYYLLLSVLFIFVMCNNNHTNKQNSSQVRRKEKSTISKKRLSEIDTISLGLNFTKKSTYKTIKQDITIKRKQFQKKLLDATSGNDRKMVINEANSYFTEKLLNDIIPYWYGTVWDFNGYTNTPNEGVVACGYFVSTTLKHMGLNINRYKLAQQAGLYEAKSLQPNGNLLVYHITKKQSFDDIMDKIKKQLKEGLYFVGLSNHVGYLYVKNNEIYFLNSDYANGYVIIEKAAYSRVFRSKIYVIANISHNDFLISNWINNTKITILTK